MPRTKAIEEIAGLMKGLRSVRQQSPFFIMVIQDEWLVSFDYAIVVHSIHSMLKNSIHSIQKLMNGPTDESECDGGVPSDRPSLAVRAPGQITRLGSPAQSRCSGARPPYFGDWLDKLESSIFFS